MIVTSSVRPGNLNRVIAPRRGHAEHEGSAARERRDRQREQYGVPRVRVAGEVPPVRAGPSASAYTNTLTTGITTSTVIAASASAVRVTRTRAGRATRNSGGLRGQCHASPAPFPRTGFEPVDEHQHHERRREQHRREWPWLFAVGVRRPSSSRVTIRNAAISVLNGMFPERTPRCRTRPARGSNASANPREQARQQRGNVTQRNVCHATRRAAPRPSSASASSAPSTGCRVRTTKGNPMKTSTSTTASGSTRLFNSQRHEEPAEPPFATYRFENTSPATAVGSANADRRAHRQHACLGTRISPEPRK